MTNQTNNPSCDMDDLLDATLDDLPDAPEFKPFPAGAHRCSIQWAFKEIGGLKNCPEITLKMIETVEASDTEATPAKAGDTTSVAYMLKKKDKDNPGQFVTNEIAAGQFKEVLKSLSAGGFAGASGREIMEASNGAEVLVVTGTRADKRDQNNIKYYTDIKSLQVM
jgi:hypothetical protein